MVRVLYFGLIFLSLAAGCLSPVKSDVRAAVVEKTLACNTQTDVAGGRDVFNISPTVAVSGGGGILACLLIASLGGWLRSRKTLKAIVGCIEKMAEGAEVKAGIAKAAREGGVADYLHGKVQRWRVSGE